MGLILLKWVFFLFCVGTVFYLGWKKPAVLPSILGGAVAFDISITWFPALGPLGNLLDSFARLCTVGVIGAALWRLWLEPEKRRELKAILTYCMSRALLIYIAAGAISILYSIGRGQTALEVFRLLTLFLLYLGICLLAERKDALLPFQVVHWVGVALVPLTLYEFLTRHFIWRGYLAEGEIARVNATFVDPNILARYLVLAIVAGLLLQYFSTLRWKRNVYLAALLGLVGALAITLSRSGIVTLVLALILLVILIPRKRLLQPLGLLGLIEGVIAALQPEVWQRLLTFREGLGALDQQRAYLWKVAEVMFRDHPLLGVGLGGFQKMFLTHYLSYKTKIPYVQGATLSHTTVLTIAAELGLMGLAALVWVWATVLRLLGRLRREGINRGDHKHEEGLDQNGLARYILGVGYFVWIAAVFISSQAEARFFEDPMIWLSLGMMVCLLGETRSEKRRESKITGH